MTAFRKTAHNILNTLLGVTGFQLVRAGENSHVINPYRAFKRTQAEARTAGLSVGDYIDCKFQVPGATQATIDQLASLGILGKGARSICEIGPGSGRYLERVQRLCRPSSYEIYEPDKPWSEWLARRYSVKAHNADGFTLRATTDGSVDLMHAHKVFVYLRSIVMCRYFDEMIRVTRDGGWIVFDIFSENCMTDAALEKWVTAGVFYPCMMSLEFVLGFFRSRGCSLLSRFFAPMKPGESEYLVFVKDGAWKSDSCRDSSCEQGS